MVTSQFAGRLSDSRTSAFEFAETINRESGYTRKAGRAANAGFILQDTPPLGLGDASIPFLHGPSCMPYCQGERAEARVLRWPTGATSGGVTPASLNPIGFNAIRQRSASNECRNRNFSARSRDPSGAAGKHLYQCEPNQAAHIYMTPSPCTPITSSC